MIHQDMYTRKSSLSSFRVWRCVAPIAAGIRVRGSKGTRRSPLPRRRLPAAPVSPTPDPCEPPAQNPTPPPTPAARSHQGPARRRNTLRPRTHATQRDEDRLIDVLHGMGQPAPHITYVGHFLLSLEGLFNQVPRSRQTEACHGLLSYLESLIPPDGSSDQAGPPLPAPHIPHPPPHDTPMHTHHFPAYPQTHTRFPHHRDTGYPRSHSPDVYPSTSAAHSTISNIHMPLGSSTRGMMEDMQAEEPIFLPPYCTTC